MSLLLLVVAVVAALTTAALCPYVARLARWVGAVDVPDEGAVHTRPTPTLGGLAVLAGCLAGLAVARLTAEGPVAEVFSTTSEPTGLLVGAVLIAALGVVDDRFGLSPPAKLAGQVAASLPAVLAGIQIVHAWVPGLGVVAVSPGLGVPLTVLVIVAMVNAVNIMDGLDGLAAGIVAIAGAAFLIFVTSAGGLAGSSANVATLATAATTGAAVGFLRHNFHPARMFMGDTGSMLLGFMLGCAGVSFVGRTTDPGYLDLAGVFPLAIPGLVLALAFADSAFAVVRRLRRGSPLGSGDRDHVHHRLMRSGLGHRGAVLVLYAWSVLVAFVVIGSALLAPLLVVVVATAGSAITTAVMTIGMGRAPVAEHRDPVPVLREVS